MSEKIAFEEVRARTYRKRAEVLAFRSESPFGFEKSWGSQHVRAGGWVIVPLADEGVATDDLYSCDADVFEATYEPVPSLRPNRFRKTETVQAYQPGHTFEVDTVLADEHAETEGAQGESHDTWLVRGPGGEVYPIADAEFRRTYVEVSEPAEHYHVKTRDEHWAADGTPKRILALDGGGVRGILTLGYLERIEALLRARHDDSEAFRLSHYFDLIAGTSTGAIIAGCLAKGMHVADVRKLYLGLSDTVFQRSFFRRGVLRAKYSDKHLKRLLEEIFQSNTMGSHVIETGLLVVAKRLDTGSTWPISNNPFSEFWSAGPGDGFFSNEDYPLGKVVRASTAAPHYFAPERIEIAPGGERPHGDFVDGGVSPHNNPALLALQLVALGGFGVGWPLEVDKLMLVSVGTGAASPGVARSPFAGTHALNSLLSLMGDCAESVETMLQWLSDSPTARRIDAGTKDLGADLLAERPLLHYLRYDVQLEERWLARELGKKLSARQVGRLKDMDRPENMELLSELGGEAARHQVDEGHWPTGFDLS